MNFIFMGIGPFIVLISLNGLTLRSLIFHLKQQNPASNATTYEDRNKSGNLKQKFSHPNQFQLENLAHDQLNFNSINSKKKFILRFSDFINLISILNKN